MANFTLALLSGAAVQHFFGQKKPPPRCLLTWMGNMYGKEGSQTRVRPTRQKFIPLCLLRGRMATLGRQRPRACMPQRRWGRHIEEL